MLRRRSKRWTALAMVFAAILAVNLGASAANSVPFKGRADAVITSSVDIGSDRHLTATATGEATHLGRFIREENAVLHLMDGTLDGSLTFVAANGDELFVEFEGGFTGPGVAEGTYAITGGTGRFAGATGEAIFKAVTTDGLHFAITFDGTIDF